MSEYSPTEAPYLEIKYDLVVTILSDTIRFQIIFQEKEYASWSTETKVWRTRSGYRGRLKRLRPVKMEEDNVGS